MIIVLILSMRTFNVNIINADIGVNSHEFTSNSLSPILPVKITCFWSHKWLDRLYLIQILEGKIGAAVGLLKHLARPVCSIKNDDMLLFLHFGVGCHC